MLAYYHVNVNFNMQHSLVRNRRQALSMSRRLGSFISTTTQGDIQRMTHCNKVCAGNNWHFKSHLNMDESCDLIQWHLAIIGLPLSIQRDAFVLRPAKAEEVSDWSTHSHCGVLISMWLWYSESCCSRNSDIAQVIPSDGISSLAWLVLPFVLPVTDHISQHCSKLVRLSLWLADPCRICISTCMVIDSASM